MCGGRDGYMGSTEGMVGWGMAGSLAGGWPLPTLTPDLSLSEAHGNWGSWEPWGPCSATCSPEEAGPKPQQRRSRVCNNPMPSIIPPGLPCSGSATEDQTCIGLPFCPGETAPPAPPPPRDSQSPALGPDGSQCPPEGKGPVSHSPNPRARFPMLTCVSFSLTLSCPVDGGWSNWQASSPCSVTCGMGRIMEKRLCNNPAPRHGGKPCLGLSTRSHFCNTKIACPVDGQWTEWGEWSPCRRPGYTGDISCQEIVGQQTRTRSCKGRSPDGKRCEGSTIHIRSCYNMFRCKLEGHWSDWSSWGLCIPACGKNPVKSRKRVCQPTACGSD
uniref:Complement factor properdin n=1 Tax=Chelydra serpentina TaxID=8475 RepID=A0A8C3XMR8_CHESE